ncbi:DUF4190 domain-containing protein [Actinoplanes sp. NPDC051513]|uniref:DUF4190 domain-containing protein n=1 Tax=Actinoplanes sp. NPDC051513 TaxID=3363908 RepID=UPI0037AF940E
MTDQYPPPGSVPPPDPTGNPAPRVPSYQPPPAYSPLPSAYPPQAYPQQAYPPLPGHPQPGYPGYPPADPGVNGFAIASLICGIISVVLFCIVPLSVIFGIVALNQIRNRGQRGRGLAVAGLAVSGAGLLVFFGVLFFSFVQESTSATETPVGAVVPSVVATTPTKAPASEATTPSDEPSFVVGECLNGIAGYPTHASCSAKHDGEIYAVFNLANGAWPGKSTVEKKAEAGCGTRLGKWADHPDKLDFYYMYPDQESWPEDRSVLCVAVDTDDKKLTGSVRHR